MYCDDISYDSLFDFIAEAYVPEAIVSTEQTASIPEKEIIAEKEITAEKEDKDI